MKIKVRLIKNVLYAFGAQGISILLSLIMALIVPRLLGTEEFSYWQLFLFYSGYAGFLNMGLNDGIYLKIGGEKYETLNYSEFGSQIKFSILIQVILVLMLLWFSGWHYNGIRLWILVFTGLFAIINNFNAYLGYIFQAVNRTKNFSISMMIEKISFLVFIIVAFCFGVKKFQFLVVSYCVSKMISLVYVCVLGRKIIFSKCDKIIVIVNNAFTNMSVGIKLMLANIASMLILGCGRYMIDNVWGISAFGKFSLALTLCNLALAFISQISMVLFPELRQTSHEKLKNIYSTSRIMLSISLPMAFLLYIPLKTVLCFWLPDYKESIYMLGFLLPLCTYDGKMNLLCNTYFKVLRKEKVLLYVNLLAVVISFLFSGLGAYLYKSINVIVFGMVLVIALRSIISELILAQYMDVDIKKDIVSETILVFLYVLSILFLTDIMAFVLNICMYTVFVIFNKRNIFILIRK